MASQGSTCLVTGAAGFIGAAVTNRLLDMGCRVHGIDNLNDYYDPALKLARLERLQAREGFSFERADIADRPAMTALFGSGTRFDIVIHLAAQAGVRHSIDHPETYVDANLVGFGNILEGCRHGKAGHLVYASSSSVYGANGRLPFSEQHNVDHPVSLYAATKKANELMAHVYAHLYGLPCTGLRFFTVYGPWGRPDMALFKFTRGIIAGESIPIYNNGRMRRDFTFVDDIVEGVVRIAHQPARSDSAWNALDPDPATSSAPYRVFNIGNNEPVDLMHYVGVLEQCLGRKAEPDFQPIQPGDVEATWADTSALEEAVQFRPATPVEIGVQRFVDWYLSYYDVSRGEAGRARAER